MVLGRLKFVIASFIIFVLILSFSHPVKAVSLNMYICGWRNGSCTPVAAGCSQGSSVPTQNACSGVAEASCSGTTGACETSQTTGGAPEEGGTISDGPTIDSCSGGKGFQTAIGCIPVESSTGFATFFLRWGMGLAGGLALSLIGYAGFLIMTSSADPQKLQSGKELLTAAVSGVVLLLFGTFALRFIGVDILGLDQFGFGS